MALYVRLISAQLTRDTQTFSNMDPYCLVELGSDKRRSKTIQEGGKKPVWNQQFVFNGNSVNTLVVIVMDQDVVTDDIVGRGTVNVLSHRNSSSPVQEIVQLTYEGKSAGQVKMAFWSKNANNFNQQQQIPYHQQQQYQQPYQPPYQQQPPPQQQPLYPSLSPPVDLSNNGWGNFQPGSNYGAYVPPPNNPWGTQQMGQVLGGIGAMGNTQPNNQMYGSQGNVNPQIAQGMYGVVNQPPQNQPEYQLVQGMTGLFKPQGQQNNGWGQQQNNGWGQQQNNGWGQQQNNPYGKNNGWDIP